jgi:hypothetical protein
MSDNVVKQIAAEDLRHMNNQEGLILQGCGGDLREWLDGINDQLTEAGILLDGSRFKSVSVFQQGGLTNLLFPFEGVKLDMGKLAMWRLQTHGQFGGTWLSDYVPNRRGGFVRSQQPPQKPKMELLDQDGNIYAILGRASMLLKEAGMRDQIDEMFQRCAASGDYYKALHIISEYVDTELSTPSIESQKSPKKSHKTKARNTHER